MTTKLDVHAGRPVHRGPLTIVPLFLGTAVAATRYDLRASTLTVSERAGSPIVEELVATNTGARPVLVLEGELLEGGMQLRVAARTVVVAPGTSVVLQVRCGERSRWRSIGGTARGGRRAPVRVRARVPEGQQRTWDSIAEYERSYGATPTSSLVDATRSAAAEAGHLVRGLRPVPFQTGVLFGISGQPVLAELYQSPRMLAEAYSALLTSVAVDAVGLPGMPTPGRRVRRFLDRMAAVPLVAEGRAGAATALTGRSPYVSMNVTAFEGSVIHAVGVSARHSILAGA